MSEGRGQRSCRPQPGLPLIATGYPPNLLINAVSYDVFHKLRTGLVCAFARADLVVGMS